LQGEGKEFSLLFVGSGQDGEALKQLAGDLRLKNVHFHPSQPPEVMPSIYRSGDVLIFPTLEDPWGLVANEAILSGLPVLCSKYAGCAEELFHPENIFDPEDPEEFAAKLREAIADQLPASDPSRLKTTAHILSEIVYAVERSANEGAKRPTNAVIGRLDQ
jgi:glycosyltransferase involved in cell wall biosynthesis